VMGQRGSCPLMKLQALPGPAIGCAYDAEGMQRASDSCIGFPSRSTSASWMLVFLMPADVRRSFMRPPGVVAAGELDGSVRARDRQITRNSSATGRSGLAALGSLGHRLRLSPPARVFFTLAVLVGVVGIVVARAHGDREPVQSGTWGREGVRCHGPRCAKRAAGRTEGGLCPP